MYLYSIKTTKDLNIGYVASLKDNKLVIFKTKEDYINKNQLVDFIHQNIEAILRGDSLPSSEFNMTIKVVTPQYKKKFQKDYTLSELMGAILLENPAEDVQESLVHLNIMKVYSARRIGPFWSIIGLYKNQLTHMLVVVWNVFSLLKIPEYILNSELTKYIIGSNNKHPTLTYAVWQTNPINLNYNFIEKSLSLNYYSDKNINKTGVLKVPNIMEVGITIGDYDLVEHNKFGILIYENSKYLNKSIAKNINVPVKNLIEFKESIILITPSNKNIPSYTHIQAIAHKDVGDLYLSIKETEDFIILNQFYRYSNKKWAGFRLLDDPLVFCKNLSNDKGINPLILLKLRKFAGARVDYVLTDYSPTVKTLYLIYCRDNLYYKILFKLVKCVTTYFNKKLTAVGFRIPDLNKNSSTITILNSNIYIAFETKNNIIVRRIHEDTETVIPLKYRISTNVQCLDITKPITTINFEKEDSLTLKNIFTELTWIDENGQVNEHIKTKLLAKTVLNSFQ